MTLEFSPERPAVWRLPSSANSILLKFHYFLCCVLLFSLVTQLPMIIKWNLPDGRFYPRRWLVFLLYLWKLALDQTLSSCPYLEIAFGCCSFVCISQMACPSAGARLNDRWVCHACRHFDPCQAILPARRWGAERLFYKDVIYQHYLPWRN